MISASAICTVLLQTVFISASSIGRISDESIGDVRNHDHRSQDYVI